MEEKNSVFESERELDKSIQHFQTLLGIVDEGEIISNDDYESSYAVSYSDVKSGGRE